MIGIKKKSVSRVMEDAVASFNTAGEKVADAITTIESQRVALNEQRKTLDTEIGECETAAEKLSRIRQRIEDFIS